MEDILCVLISSVAALPSLLAHPFIADLWKKRTSEDLDECHSTSGFLARHPDPNQECCLCINQNTACIDDEPDLCSMFIIERAFRECCPQATKDGHE